MTSKWHVFMTRDGRITGISMAGLNSAAVAQLADALVDSFKPAMQGKM